MAEIKLTNTNETLIEDILGNERKKDFHRSSFIKIENEVKASLKSQETDQALEKITIGAMYLGSSDIHYDGYEKYIVIRFRIDGMLVDIFRLSHKEYKLIKERLKYASSLKLNITNIPQDGKYSLQVQEKKLDVRVSTLPIKYTENIVCRILDHSSAQVDFEDL